MVLVGVDDEWECPECGHQNLWAEILRGRVICEGCWQELKAARVLERLTGDFDLNSQTYISIKWFCGECGNQNHHAIDPRKLDASVVRIRCSECVNWQDVYIDNGDAVEHDPSDEP